MANMCKVVSELHEFIQQTGGHQVILSPLIVYRHETFPELLQFG